MERLTFEGNFCDIAMCRENPCPYNGMCSQRQTWDRLKEYEDAEQNGRLVVLPCKVGDIALVKDRAGVPREMRMEAPDIRFVCTDEDNFCAVTCNRKPDGYCAYRIRNDGSDIGKTVFLTREEAETALALEGGKDHA